MTRRLAATVSLGSVLTLLVWFGPVSSQPANQRQPVRLRVLLPHPYAKLTIEGATTRQTGTNRQFVSPPLEPGRNYTYTLTAVWEPNNYTTITRTRQVSVQAGQELELDLRQADPANPYKIVVIYVPTPDEVVDAMCKLAKVTKDDVVYDLGCGDGRIVITAVKQYGAVRGVGVDIDPERIEESRENARKAGVQDKVEFRQEDVLAIKDLADASVVMLYMGEELNLRLRPILQKTLKPGARIVSHRFTMGGWKPLKTEQITDEYGGEYDIHLWKIEANGNERKD
jgi:uncharacterized protein (TIGR03000 family)